MASPTFFPDGHTPNPTDPRWFILQRILGALIDGGGGGGGGSGGVSSGVIDPVAAPTNVNIDNFYVNTASVPKTGWFWPAGGGAWAQIF